jgi:enterochelin esterase family protein
MTKLSLFYPLVALTLATAAVSAQDLAGDMTLHRLLIPGENWQLVAEGLGFADGPCIDEAGNLFFSDLKGPAAGIYRIAIDGTKTKVSDEASSGMRLGPDGRLYGCQGNKKRLIALDLKTGQVDILAENVSPNDLVVSRKGYIYFTETGKHQVTFVDAKTKAIRAADVGITGPNGIGLSPDQSSLAVSDYKGVNVWLFRVETDGALTAKTPYMTMRLPIDPKAETKPHEPPPYKAEAGGDGMCVDTIGRYYVTSALGLQVFDPTGRLCGVLPKPQLDKPLTNAALAGPNREYLYITNGDKIFRRKVQATGAIWYK